MKFSHIKFIIVVIIATLYGCSTGYKAYRNGDYYTACMQAIERLRSSPENKKAQAALVSAYPLTIKGVSSNAMAAMESGNLNKMDAAIATYDRLNVLAIEIKHCPAALNLIPETVEYHKELRAMMNLAGEMSYQRGLKALESGTMDDAKTAYSYFNRTARYLPNYRDVTSKIAEARYKATTRVIVLKPSINGMYGINGDFFYNKLMEKITRNTYKNFVRFFTIEEAAAENMNTPHHLIVLDFEKFTIGDTRRSSNTVELKRDSVIVGTTTVDGRSQKVYGTVKAKYTTHRIEVLSAGVLGIRIINPTTDRVIMQKRYANESVWMSQWASYNGDERALIQKEIDLANRKPQPLPPPQYLFEDFASPLYSQAISFISSVY